MVPLTTTSTPFEARVLAAHLGAEGIVWELRGNVDGPYPVGPVVVLVAEDDLAVAREVVSEQPDEAAVQGADTTGGSGRGDRAMWVVLAVVVLTAATLLGRLLMLTWH
jgi:hypothetical protein